MILFSEHDLIRRLESTFKARTLMTRVLTES